MELINYAEWRDFRNECYNWLCWHQRNASAKQRAGARQKNRDVQQLTEIEQRELVYNTKLVRLSGMFNGPMRRTVNGRMFSYKPSLRRMELCLILAAKYMNKYRWMAYA